MAQNINGAIKTQSGEAIAFANIAVLNSPQGTVADNSGRFTLALNQGTYQLQFSAIGYASKVREVVVSGESQVLNIVLSESTETLGEVVVTANKREESIVKVPTSITSLSAQKIEDTRTWELAGLTALVPNYLYQGLGVGFQQVQSIRGIQVFSENPAVSTYIDDVNNIDILANGFALTDIERIEVLRGPQGTLFGRNAMGGVVNIYTKEPNNQPRTFAELTVGNLGLWRSSLGFKTPLVKNKLFLGANALYQTREGYWENDTTGVLNAELDVYGRTVGGENNFYGNLYLKWLPTDRLSFTLNLKGQRDWSDNSGFFVSQSDRDLAVDNPDVINLARIGEHRRRILNSSLVGKYFADDFTLTSITAYQTIGLSFQDIDFPGFYHSFYENEIGENLPPQEVWSQELRINSENDSRLQYTAGLYGFTQIGFEPSTNLAFELDSENYAIFRNESDNYGIAAFGELRYRITRKLQVTAGIRYDHEQREATFNGFGDAVYSGGVFTQIVPDTTVSVDYSAVSPKLAISYALNEQSNVYASYTRGFRAGGVNAQRLPVNAPQTFDPEYSNNYEVGYKTYLANNKLSIGTAGFLIHWQDLQFFNLVAPFTYARENVGDAQSMGLEIEVAAIPVRGLQLDASFGLNETRYEQFVLDRVNFFTGEESSTDITDNRLSNAPGHTFFLGAQYEYSFSKKLKATIRGELRSVGRYFTDIQNQIEQPSYQLVNARIGLSYDQYSFFFWGQNLNNERYLSFGNPDSSFGRSVRTAAPRTYGITLSARF